MFIKKVFKLKDFFKIHPKDIYFFFISFFLCAPVHPLKLSSVVVSLAYVKIFIFELVTSHNIFLFLNLAYVKILWKL